MQNENFGLRAVNFYRSLTYPQIQLSGIEVIRPFAHEGVLEYTEQFLMKFYSDNHKRIFVFGINPGRFGSGTTGIPFTDPVALERDCSIPNTFVKRRELSSEFVYRVIQDWGGPEQFYQHFYLSALSPVGFVRGGKNCNYYDDPELLKITLPYIVDSMAKQIAIGADRMVAIVFGTGKNQKVFASLNENNGWFTEVHFLEHPRYILQYKRSHLSTYLEKYRTTLQRAVLTSNAA